MWAINTEPGGLKYRGGWAILVGMNEMRIGDRGEMRQGAAVRQVTVVAIETSVSHGTRYRVAWPSRIATDPTYPGQATVLLSATALRVG